MSLIDWNPDKLSVNDETMDEQHQKWVKLINDLDDSLLSKDKKASPILLVREMLAYAEYHFSEEEKLMRDINYPGHEQHIELHANFRTKLRVLESEVKEGYLVRGTQIMKMMKNWLELHIAVDDRHYGEFIASKSEVKDRSGEAT